MRNWRFYITWIVIAVSQSAAGKSSDTLIAEKVDNAWKIVWERFCHSSTMLFYDYISSYEKGKELSHLPTTKEIKEQYPNPCGYGTGMEDCMILSGTMLETIVDRYETTGETQMNEYASNLFKGIVSCSLIESCPGFVARGICVEDDKSFYINSSRDQYTHAVYGLWKYYNSPLCSSGQQDTIRLILTNIAERLIKNVTSENNYDLLRADNRPCPLGICRMWNVQSHEATRLPMFYAAAWAVTGKEKYYEQYKRYIDKAIEQSLMINDQHSAYVFVQMSYSFDLLLALETDEGIKAKLRELKRRVGEMSLARAKKSLEELRSLDASQLSMLGPDWRQVSKWDVQNGYNIPRWGEYRNVWNLIREVGESALGIFMSGDKSIYQEGDKIMETLFSSIDYDQVSSCGIIFHIAAYWESQKAEVDL